MQQKHDVYHSRHFTMALLGLAALLAACGEKAEALEAVPEESMTPRSPLHAAVEPETPTLQAEEIVEAPAIEEPEDEPSSNEPELYGHAGISLRRMMLAREIEEREPVTPSSSFELSNDELFAFVDVRNESDEEQTLTVTFEGPEMRSAGHIELSIPANVSRWRTWAYTRNANVAGEWFAEVRSADGTLLGRHPFVID